MTVYNPFVSILIPAYNAEKYIEETIQSVLDQTYQKWELIIVNDGSTDRTETMVTSFLSDPRIKYIQQKNSGVSTARNNGMALSGGDYIAFLDADDTWTPDNLEKKITFLKKSPDYNWVFSDMSLMDAHSTRYARAPVGRDDDMLQRLLLWEGEVVPGPCSNIIITRKCYVQGVRFDPGLTTTADRCFCVQLAKQFKGKRIPSALFNYRTLGNSMSRNMEVTEKDNLYFYEKYRKQGLLSPFWFKQKCFSNIYSILAGSWYSNGKNPVRATYFMIKSILLYPPNISKFLAKALKLGKGLFL